ncbi:transmembrane protein, putative (macronuclear) [Tetrahymena thermophila SB210]|uniref:Transmembrane protein, putative n=1 Tax=Tetrahymena thermophila (strain SB210) TaxID=312017 RepID=W7XGH8_TETTS|nr:transmembrane protein, putative [Tetrahymena thermophila SB210]EWS76098.1 transmembrane protein, putative [Tetrahymena thermophila SB210]|eukprot:XP_012651338.1 transmembrane protein, putative [Tetrahymena thermophila SB210]
MKQQRKKLLQVQTLWVLKSLEHFIKNIKSFQMRKQKNKTTIQLIKKLSFIYKFSLYLQKIIELSINNIMRIYVYSIISIQIIQNNLRYGLQAWYYQFSKCYGNNKLCGYCECKAFFKPFKTTYFLICLLMVLVLLSYIQHLVKYVKLTPYSQSVCAIKNILLIQFLLLLNSIHHYFKITIKANIIIFICSESFVYFLKPIHQKKQTKQSCYFQLPTIILFRILLCEDKTKQQQKQPQHFSKIAKISQNERLIIKVFLFYCICV